MTVCAYLKGVGHCGVMSAAVVLCLCTLAAAQTGNIAIVPSAQLDTCNAIDTLWITGDANIAGVKAAEFKVGYAHAYVTVTGVIRGAGLDADDQLFPVIDNGNDSVLISIAILGAGDVFNGAGSLAGIILSTVSENSATEMTVLRSTLRDINNNGITHNSAGAAIHIDCTVPDVPILSWPADGSYGSDNTPTFTWGTASGVYTYTLQYATNSGFTTGVTTVSGLTDVTHTPSALADGVWYWHVRAVDQAGNECAYSSVWMITIDTQAPDVPVLLSPSDGNYTNDNTPAFTWGAASGAYTYTLQYATNSGFTTGVTTVAGISGESYTPSVLTDGVWYWRVKAIDRAANESAYAGAWSLTVDTQVPGAPTAFAVRPGHNKVHLSWTNAGGDVDHTVIMRSDWCASGSGYPRYDEVHAEGPYPSDTTSTWDKVYSGTGTSHDDVYQISSATRDVYHYTAFAVDRAGNVSSPVSSAQGRATSYWLGDKTKDGEVYFVDLTYLSNTYWLSYGAPGYDPEFDIGPTADNSSTGVPLTDNVVNFEDLVIFALNFDVVRPTAKAVPLFADQDIAGQPAISLSSSGDGNAVGGQYTVRVDLVNSPSTVKAVRCVLDYDHTALRLVGTERGPELRDVQSVFFDGREREDGIDLSVALLGGGRTLSGAGTLATLRFQVVKAGNLSTDLAMVDVRDSENQKLTVAMAGNSADVPVPETYTLSQNYPNPFNPSTTIAFQVPQAGYVTLRIINIQGQVVRTLLEGDKGAGSYQVVWDSRDDAGKEVATGIYLYRLVTENYTCTKKMLLLK